MRTALLPIEVTDVHLLAAGAEGTGLVVELRGSVMDLDSPDAHTAAQRIARHFGFAVSGHADVAYTAKDGALWTRVWYFTDCAVHGVTDCQLCSAGFRDAAIGFDLRAWPIRA